MTCEERLVLVSPRSRVVRVNRSISRSRVDAPRGATLYAPDPRPAWRLPTTPDEQLIFVRPYPNVNDAVTQVSTTGGSQPQ